MFDGGAAGRKEDGPDLKVLHAKIGQQVVEIDFLSGTAQQGGIAERKEMIDRMHDLPVARHLEKRNGKRGTIDPETVSQGEQLSQTQDDLSGQPIPVFKHTLHSFREVKIRNPNDWPDQGHHVKTCRVPLEVFVVNRNSNKRRC